MMHAVLQPEAEDCCVVEVVVSVLRDTVWEVDGKGCRLEEIGGELGDTGCEVDNKGGEFEGKGCGLVDPGSGFEGTG